MTPTEPDEVLFLKFCLTTPGNGPVPLTQVARRTWQEAGSNQNHFGPATLCFTAIWDQRTPASETLTVDHAHLGWLLFCGREPVDWSRNGSGKELAVVADIQKMACGAIPIHSGVRDTAGSRGLIVDDIATGRRTIWRHRVNY